MAPIQLLAAVLLGVVAATHAKQLLPPRLSSKDDTVHVEEGQTGFVLECKLDVGDDPIAYRWLKEHKWVTGALGYAYRSHRKLHLAFHAVHHQHAGQYICEAANEAGIHNHAINVIVDSSKMKTKVINEELPRTDEVLSDLAASMSDVFAEGGCKCDSMFLVHFAPDADAPSETVAAQANLVYTIGEAIVSDEMRVSVMTYSDKLQQKLAFGKGTNHCALRDAFQTAFIHDRWPTNIRSVLREAFKKFKKSKSDCKILFLPLFGFAQGLNSKISDADLLEAQSLKKLGIKIFVLEVTKEPIEGVSKIASQRGDGKPYHWRLPQHIWPTIVMYMKYMTEELEGCMVEPKDLPGVCVGIGSECTRTEQCRGFGIGCVKGTCEPLQCNIDTTSPGCCSEPGDYWCGDVMRNCTSSESICDGRVNCMNGADEDRCWSTPCPDDKIARCQSSTLCLDLLDLCDGNPQCPGGEDEDPRFCRSFPCPVDRPFRCRSGKCISNDRICDGKFMDCEEGEDEDLGYCSRNHRCPATLPFKCDYGICIPERMMCDGKFNCLDASDELVCSKTPCPADRSFKCNNGQCVGEEKVCNGVKDGCQDGSDETNCTSFECPLGRNFKCDNGKCIARSLVCDNVNDCQDNTDELICQRSTTDRTITDRTTTTEETIKLVEGVEKGAAYSPTTEESIRLMETTTKGATYKCPMDKFSCQNGACILLDQVCDGRRHCGNGEDEKNCADFVCPSDRSFRCDDDTTCATRCDKFPQCKDLTDESDCSDSVVDKNSETEVDIKPKPVVKVETQVELQLEPNAKLEPQPEYNPNSKNMLPSETTKQRDEPEETEIEDIDSILMDPEIIDKKPKDNIEKNDKTAYIQPAEPSREGGSGSGAGNIHGFTIYHCLLLILTFRLAAIS